jgi:rhamnosyltransferase
LNTGILDSLAKKYEFVLLLDQDSTIKQSSVLELQKELQSKSQAFIAGAIYDQSDNTNLFTTECLVTISSGSLLRLSMIPAIGLHNEELFIDYVDFEYSLRVNSLGYKVLKVPTATMIHKLGNFQEINLFGFHTYITNHPPIRKYYRLRNSLYVWKKYFFYFPRWITVDILRSCKDIFKCLIFESNRLEQSRAYCYAIRDFLKAKYGRIDSL